MPVGGARDEQPVSGWHQEMHMVCQNVDASAVADGSGYRERS